MYARVSTEAIWSPMLEDALGTAARQRDFREGWVLRHLSASYGIVVTLWGTHASAAGGPQRTVRPPADVYRVRQAEDASSADRRPPFAYIVRLNGPRSAEQARADERDGLERIWPAIRQTAGLVRLIAGVGPGRSAVVLALTTDTQTIDHVLKTIKAAPLLPFQDPALLTAPDRVDVCAVTAGLRAGAMVR
jgi:hypothetical protein